MIRQESGISSPFKDSSNDQADFSSPDTLVSSELIKGHPFRVPSIVRPTGKGDYDFADLALPEGWQDVRDSIASLNWDRKRMIFNALCIDNNAIPVDVVVDETGLLRQVQVGVDKKFGGGQASVVLTQNGEYRATGMNNIRTYIPLMATVADFLNSISYFQKDERQIASISQNGDAFGSADLFIPDTCLESDGEITTPEYREEFTKRAKSIGLQLGDRIKYVLFNQQGVLQEFALDFGFGGACNYSLNREFGLSTYIPHNVDGPGQAIVLHSIAAAFINDMLDVGHTYTQFGLYDDK